MSWLERLKARLFGYENIEPEGIMPSVRHEAADTVSTAVMSETKQEGMQGMPQRVLFVCSGNICRSAYGAVKFEQLLEVRRMSMRIASAGTLRIVGRPAAPEMIATADERSLDLTKHRSTALSQTLIEAADVIFAMENAHKQELMRICPNCSERIVMLGQCLPNPKGEIADPMGCAPAVYREVADEIDLALENWLDVTVAAKPGDV